MDNRNLSVDLVKIVAMVGVMSLHSMKQYAIPDQFGLADVLYKTAVVSMPLFFMVSGYLLIGREQVCYCYSFRKIWGIVRFVSTIVILYWIVRSVYHFRFDFMDLARSLLRPYFQKGPFGIFWYFGSMIILYLFYPLMNSLYHKRRNLYVGVMIAMLMVCYTLFIGNLLEGVFRTSVNEVTICQTFRIWISTSYFMIGGLLRGIKSPRYSGIILFGLFLMNIVIQEWLCQYIGNDYCEYFYSSIYVQLLSVLLFLYIMNINIIHNRIISGLSRLFLPVYVIHPFVISLVSRCLLPFDYWWRSLTCWIVVCVISIGVSFIVMKIRFMDKIFRI